MQLSFNEIVANGGIPDQPGIAESYFRHLLENRDETNAREAWAWLGTRRPDDRLAETYIDFLVARGRMNDAAAAWHRQLGSRCPDFGRSSFVLNGDFENEFYGPLFGWRVAPDSHVEVGGDKTVSLSGGSSLRLEFDGKINAAYEGVFQRVFIPRGTYRFEAFVRTNGITTDEGVGFRIRDHQMPNAYLVETERIKGTNDWKRLEGKFVVGAPSALVEISAFRRASLRFDSLIAGTAWIDNISLTRLN
jgi:hypothetical protein